MNRWREQFLLDPNVVFLNHGSFGACPRTVFAEYQRLQRELESEPVDFLHLDRTWPRRMEIARGALAAYVGAGPDDLVFVPNATYGVNVVARSLDLGPGDEVLTTDHEYGACDRTWSFVCEKAGARFRRCTLPLPLDDADEVIEAVWKDVNKNTRVLFLSHITSPTALVMPVAALVRRARERGIITVIDGAHAPGQLDLDLAGLGADFYTGNGHKWLLAPKGVGFLHARRDRQDLLEPLVVSWGWRSDRPGPSRFVDEHQWTGTRDPAAALAVPAALDFHGDPGWRKDLVGCGELLRRARREILDLTGLPPLCDEIGWLAQMATLPLPNGDAAAMGRRLRRDHAVEAPVFAFAGRNWIRISIQPYNGPDDVAALVAALRQLI